MYRLEIELPILPKMTNRRGSSHWRGIHAERKAVKLAVKMAIRKHKTPPRPLVKAHLTLTRYSSVAPDPDGLVSGFKAVIDSLVECGVIENDRFTNIGMPTFLWEKSPPKQGKISVVVEEIR